MEKVITGICFKTRLNDLLKEQKITQKELSEFIGVSKQSISFYVNGKRIPDIEILNRICEYFNVSADYLLGRTNVRSSNVEDQGIHERLGLSDRAIDMLEKYNKKFGGMRLIPVVNILIEQERPVEFIEIAEYLTREKKKMEEEGVSKEEINKMIDDYDSSKQSQWLNEYSPVLERIEAYFELDFQDLIDRKEMILDEDSRDEFKARNYIELLYIQDRLKDVKPQYKELVEYIKAFGND